MRAQLAPRARREIVEVARWIARDSPSATRSFMAAIHQATVQIGAYPQAGTLRLELLPDRYRFLMLPRFPYLLVYDTQTSPPIVARVLHAARDLPAALRSLR